MAEGFRTRLRARIANALRNASFFPGLLTIVAAAGVGMFILQGEIITAQIGSELFVMTYQFLLLIVLGSGVGVIFQAITHHRELRERGRRLQREIHLALVCGYNDAKRARRLLRARGRRDPDGGISASEYDTHLQSLSDAQLAIELATRRIEFNRALFIGEERLVKSLDLVGKYLNRVVDEWEDARPRIFTNVVSAELRLRDLPELDMFLRSPNLASAFRTGFKEPFDEALELLEESLRSDT